MQIPFLQSLFVGLLLAVKGIAAKDYLTNNRVQTQRHNTEKHCVQPPSDLTCNSMKGSWCFPCFPGQMKDVTAQNYNDLITINNKTNILPLKKRNTKIHINIANGKINAAIELIGKIEKHDRALKILDFRDGNGNTAFLLAVKTNAGPEAILRTANVENIYMADSDGVNILMLIASGIVKPDLARNLLDRMPSNALHGLAQAHDTHGRNYKEYGHLDTVGINNILTKVGINGNRDAMSCMDSLFHLNILSPLQYQTKEENIIFRAFCDEYSLEIGISDAKGIKYQTIVNTKENTKKILSALGTDKGQQYLTDLLGPDTNKNRAILHLIDQLEIVLEQFSGISLVNQAVSQQAPNGRIIEEYIQKANNLIENRSPSLEEPTPEIAHLRKQYDPSVTMGSHVKHLFAEKTATSALQGRS